MIQNQVIFELDRDTKNTARNLAGGNLNAPEIANLFDSNDNLILRPQVDEYIASYDGNTEILDSFGGGIIKLQSRRYSFEIEITDGRFIIFETLKALASNSVANDGVNITPIVVQDFVNPEDAGEFKIRVGIISELKLLGGSFSLRNTPFIEGVTQQFRRIGKGVFVRFSEIDRNYLF